MQGKLFTHSYVTTLVTLVVAGGGAVLGWLVSAPVYVLLGPAVAVSFASMAFGLRTQIADPLRDLCFVILGLAVGAGFDADALAAMIRWPLAFVVMGITLWVILFASRALLVRFFGFGRRAAILAAAPGHLSFVIAMAHEIDEDVARISITQSVRLLSLTLIVPFVAIALGVDVGGSIALQGEVMTPFTLLCLAIAGVLLGMVFMRLLVPAPLLMGCMVASGVGHISGVAPGVLPEWLVLPAYLVLGAMIGTRFSGLTFAQLRASLGAGLAVTTLAVLCAGVASLPVAVAFGMPVAHVLIAFAPGGLETMIAMGVVLGVVPGFVAASHIARLLVLTFLLPMMLRQRN